MAGKILFTGFPGFLGAQLVPRVLERSPGATALCLVQKKFEQAARARAAELIGAQPSLEGRIELVEGDITLHGLGLPDRSALGDVVGIFHLAALYDLAVKRDLAMKVNLDGTVNVLGVAAHCDALQHFHYVSTCYVSGRYPGAFREGDLSKGQHFNNFYEETKYLAEVEVQKRMQEGLPATIYRPSIVVGDSVTGATQKYDGPYYIIRWILKQPTRLALMPVVGDPSIFRINVVPSDFAIDAMAHLSAQQESLGKVFALADPDPMTVAELLDELERATGRRLINMPLPLRMAKWAVRHVPGVYRLMGIPAEAIDYFVHPTYYDTTNTMEALRGSGIEAPSLRNYLPNLVSFVREHPNISSQAMA
ncbi:MAG: SDR family oxidoreductase [Actinomycetota bacterium]